MFLHACALQFERVNLMASPTLSSLEEIVRRMIVDEARTQEEVSKFLRRMYPLARGFSVRSIQRFCSAQGIHRTSRLCDAVLDQRVKASVEKVFWEGKSGSRAALE